MWAVNSAGQLLPRFLADFPASCCQPGQFRSDEVEVCWRFVQPILDYLNNPDHELYGYAAGTWGPQEAEQLVAASGHAWRFPCKNLTHAQHCAL